MKRSSSGSWHCSDQTHTIMKMTYCKRAAGSIQTRRYAKVRLLPFGPQVPVSEHAVFLWCRRRRAGP